MKDDVIFRHRQFIRAIREQISHVEKSLEDASIGNPVRNNEWVYLNEEDRNGLALFLSGGGGGGPSERLDSYDMGDSGILRRYLDSTSVTSAKDGTLQNVEHRSKELEALNLDGVVRMDHNFDSRKETNMRKVGSFCSMRLGDQAMSSLPGTSRNRGGENGSWDLEAEVAKPKSMFHENNWRRLQSRVNVFFGNVWNAFGSRVARNYIKKLKDGEEQRESPSSSEALNGAQVLILVL